MSNSTFDKFSKFIKDELGIKMPLEKKIMLESRLQKRLKALNFDSFDEYYNYVFSNNGKETELIHMMDIVTTNKTDFFREPAHFEFMQEYAIPEFSNKYGNRPMKIWSAGCSSGEEPYTIAMVLNEAVERNQLYDFQILGTDISVGILQKAFDATYQFSRVEPIPNTLLKKYFLKHKDPNNKIVRVIPQIRKKTTYQRLNFMDNTYNIQETFDIVFCRNVLIYFDRETQEKVINRLCTKLKTGGYFFLGHSESLSGFDVPLQNIKPTVFRKI
ncbi:MAG TPA: chemotaxis protein CheR [Bacteroidales bacterium]|nr:chemotaxis protein CheR [Bacteroidales bacterium]